MSLREHYGIIAGLIEGESRPNSSQGLIINPSFLVVSDKAVKCTGQCRVQTVACVVAPAHKTFTTAIETMLKDIKEYSAEEVGLWITAQGLDPSKFVSEGVDGDLLLSLSVEDLKSDLGLSSLQAKKVMKNIEFSKSLAGGNGGGGEDEEKVKALAADKKELEAKIKAQDDEIAELKKKMSEMKMETQKAAAPAPTSAPAPKHTSAPARGPGVVGGAARGAAGGAMKGAIAGAILPGMDASDGAKAGAAVGATKGGLGAIRGRRIARRG